MCVCKYICHNVPLRETAERGRDAQTQRHIHIHVRMRTHTHLYASAKRELVVAMLAKVTDPSKCVDKLLTLARVFIGCISLS